MLVFHNHRICRTLKYTHTHHLILNNRPSIETNLSQLIHGCNVRTIKYKRTKAERVFLTVELSAELYVIQRKIRFHIAFSTTIHRTPREFHLKIAAVSHMVTIRCRSIQFSAQKCYMWPRVETSLHDYGQYFSELHQSGKKVYAHEIRHIP